MTLVEAEDIYKELYGDEGYAMWHEIGDKAYKNYKLLNISDADKAKWDRDILEDNFEIFSIDPDRSWHAIRVILDVFSRGYISPEGYALRLLDEMVKLENPSDSNRIDIIHVM
nr:hypothetical protein [Eubacterium sp.]